MKIALFGMIWAPLVNALEVTVHISSRRNSHEKDPGNTL
jgi:hypothetical protein